MHEFLTGSFLAAALSGVQSVKVGFIGVIIIHKGKQRNNKH